jgi:hypothetical protein
MEGDFFVNLRFMFNEDHLAFMKGYQLKKTHPVLPRRACAAADLVDEEKG